MALVAVLASFPAFSQVGMNFKGITPSAFADAVIRGVLGKDVVMSPEVMGMNTPITVNIRRVEPDNVLPVLRATLATVGVKVEEKAGIFYVERGMPQEAAHEPVPAGAVASAPQSAPAPSAVAPGDVPGQEVFYYAPRNRTPEFLGQVARLFGARLLQSSGVMAASDATANSSTTGTNRQKMDVLVYAVVPEKNDKLRALLEELDRPIAAVHVRAALLEYSNGTDSTRSLSGVFDLLKGKLGITYAAGVKAANSLTISGASLSAVLSAVDGDNRFRYLAEPSMRVVDGETAKLTVGQDVPVRGSVSQDRNGNSLQSIEYKTSGVVLTLEPRIMKDAVLLKVGQQISSFSTTTTSAIDSPTLRKREAQTVISAAPGELIALGGMDTSEESHSSSGLSFLPSFLRGTSSSSSRSQVLLLLEVTRDQSI